MPYCPECNYEYVAGVKECPDCHASLVEGVRCLCPSCEGPVSGGVEFCPHCGVLNGRPLEGEKKVFCTIHTERAATGRCVLCGSPVCDECGEVRQGKIFCGNEQHVKMAFDWVAVTSVGTLYEAEMIKANLEGAGIPTCILSQNDRMYFTTMGDLAVTEIMVPKGLVEEAKRYLLALETKSPHIQEHK